MTANAFTAVSLDPVVVLVCVDQRARTHAHLHARKRFGVNVLSRGQQAISGYYARSAETLECRLHSTETAGDHTILVAEVDKVEVREGDPLLYFRSRYRDVPLEH